MKNLNTPYLGKQLKNPIIVGASYISSDLDNIKRIEDAGASAIVYRSLFEEQIQLERANLDDQLEEYSERHAEMISLFPTIEHAGPKEHLYNVQKAKESVSIPVFASINAVNVESWVEYAKLLQQTGIDGLELNFYVVPKDFHLSGDAVEKQQLAILREIKSAVSIPVSVKLSASYSNALNFITQLSEAGADGVVLFNRFYQPDIDIYNLNHIATHTLSNESENHLSMRFAGLLYSRIRSNVCCSSGIHQGSDVIKMILAGADAVQIVSTLYQNRISHISTMLKDIEEWMELKKFNSIEDFKGKLSDEKIKDPFVYQRAQYIDLLLRSEELLNKHPLP